MKPLSLPVWKQLHVCRWNKQNGPTPRCFIAARLPELWRPSWKEADEAGDGAGPDPAEPRRGPLSNLPGALRSCAVTAEWMMPSRLFSHDSISKDNAICQTVIEELPPQTTPEFLLNPLKGFFMSPADKQTLIFAFFLWHQQNQVNHSGEEKLFHSWDSAEELIAREEMIHGSHRRMWSSLRSYDD